jgi:hypothetical protein
MRLMAARNAVSRRFGGLLVVLFILLPGLESGCRHTPPATGAFNPQEYAPVTLEQLQAPRVAGLLPGQKVSVSGYFWQYLEYDPFAVPEYLALIRRPLLASRWRWASLYSSPRMTGYFDRLAVSRGEQRELNLKRLERVRIYGRLAHLPFGILYLQAVHVERLDKDSGAPEQIPAPSAVEGRKTPAS